MLRTELSDISMTLSASEAGVISLMVRGKELLASACPMIAMHLKMRDGSGRSLNARDAAVREVSCGEDGAVIFVFEEFPIALRVTVTINRAGEISTKIENRSDALIEWIEPFRIKLKPLKQNGGEGAFLFPYNEGAWIDDIEKKQHSWFPFRDPGYPSQGSYAVFPNMICSQFISYHAGEVGLLLMARDTARGVKMIELLPDGDGVIPLIRVFCGCDFGEDYAMPFALSLQACGGAWEDAAEIYRDWYEVNLPRGSVKASENERLPAWYEDMPLVVTYPIRGVHDMDDMKPNALFPYVNALPMLDEIAEKTGMRLLVLLMHWEGTAPWAPPYVWPPYGGEEAFNAFADALHERGHLLGVYCSGFGFTEQSNLNSFNQKQTLAGDAVWHGFCAGPDDKVQKSAICTGQRSGYDLCVASEVGAAILNEAYQPLFESKVDYVQILDQNHGGGQYFCYARDHGHPPSPGAWMTERMIDLLQGWQRRGGKRLFGCESAAAEPFLPELLLSDNRYELNYMIGKPLPLHAYLYHEYLHNFMGNQVCCGLADPINSLFPRMAYSFTAGDLLTLVFHPDGFLMTQWGWRDFSCGPDTEKALTFAAHLEGLMKKGLRKFLAHGKMCRVQAESEMDGWACTTWQKPVMLPRVFASAWECDGERIAVLVNHTESEEICRIEGKEVRVPPLDGVVLKL